MKFDNIVSVVRESIRIYYPNNVYTETDYLHDLELINQGKYKSMAELRQHQQEIDIKKIRVSNFNNLYIFLETMNSSKSVKLQYQDGVIYKVDGLKKELVDKQKLDEIMKYLLN